MAASEPSAPSAQELARQISEAVRGLYHMPTLNRNFWIDDAAAKEITDRLMPSLAATLERVAELERQLAEAQQVIEEKGRYIHRWSRDHAAEHFRAEAFKSAFDAAGRLLIEQAFAVGFAIANGLDDEHRKRIEVAELAFSKATTVTPPAPSPEDQSHDIEGTRGSVA